jgi:PTH1 family peptidyl-tRNA hydrolase
MHKLIVGLGNPGKRYEGTRHNVGFEVLRQVISSTQAEGPRAKFEGELYEGTWAGTKLLLLAPHTFMNLSGRSVRAAVQYLQLPLSEILVVCDDFNLPLGRLRFRPGGSSGGQRGLENIIQELGSPEFPRLRIGIGPLPPLMDATDFVLGRFSQEEKLVLQPILETAAKAVLDWISLGTTVCMHRYNGLQLAPGPTKSGNCVRGEKDLAGQDGRRQEEQITKGQPL